MALLGVLSACGSSSTGPAQQTTARPDGVYIIQDGKTGRLNEDPQKILKTWDQRTNLTPNVQFLVVDPSVAARTPDADSVSLQRVSKVRNNVKANGKAKPTAKTEWVVANLPQDKIPVTVVRDSSAPQQLRVTANQPLAPGLYSFVYNTGRERIGGRFGVGWAAADKTQYASLHCVDRYAGNPASYRPCNEQAAAKPKAAVKPAVQGTAASRPIEISGLKVQKEIVGGKPLLVLRGQMMNVTSSPQKVPLLLAVVTDSQGRELSRWSFRTLTDQLPPGGSASFQTSTDSPPKGTASIAVLTADSVKPRQEADSQPAGQSFMQVQELPAP
ncbi:MAG: hypothetical protein ACKVOI_02970 [Dongiaceae bacterium]